MTQICDTAIFRTPLSAAALLTWKVLIQKHGVPGLEATNSFVCYVPRDLVANEEALVDRRSL